MPSTSTRRVVITGVGLVSPLGMTKDQLWDALSQGRSGVRPIEQFPTDHLPFDCGAEVRDFTGKIDDFGELETAQKRAIRKGLKVMCREIQMGVAAAQRALQDAGLKPGQYDCRRTGCVFGSDYIMTLPDEFTVAVQSCLDGGKFDFTRWGEDGLPKITPLWLLKYLPNMPASHVAIYNDLQGPNNSLTLREASPNAALAEAYCTIMRGSADTLVVGATGTRIHPLRSIHVALQEELAEPGPDPSRLCRPFDLHRTGQVLGEGAAAVILESLESAQSRGASIVGEVVGFGSSALRHDDGMAECDRALENAFRKAMERANVSSNQLGHIHAHGNGFRRGDAQEAQAIRRVLGDHADRVPVAAAKSYMGNVGAAGGLIELITSLMAMERDWLFPVLNYETPDPECPIRVAAGGESPGDCFANLNYAPQGQASVVVVRRYQS